MSETNNKDIWRELRQLGKEVASQGSTLRTIEAANRDDHACLYELKGAMTSHIAREESLAAAAEARLQRLENREEERDRESRRFAFRIAALGLAVGGGGGGAVFGILKLLGAG